MFYLYRVLQHDIFFFFIKIFFLLLYPAYLFNIVTLTWLCFYNFICCCILTVHAVPPCCGTTENCIAWGRAKRKAVTQIAKINLTARDNFDMVCWLQEEKKKKKKKMRKIQKQWNEMWKHREYMQICCIVIQYKNVFTNASGQKTVLENLVVFLMLEIWKIKLLTGILAIVYTTECFCERGRGKNLKR